MRTNLVQGQSAGGLLRQACRQFGVPGSVYVIDDDLAVGPLCDDTTRNKWWDIIWTAEYEESYDRNLYSQWKALGDHLRAQEIEQLVIWSSNSAHDYVLDCMAAAMLKDYSGAIFRLEVPPSGNLNGVSFFKPEKLAAFETLKRALDRDTLARLANDFDQRWRNSAGIRHLGDDGLELLPDDVLDRSLLDQCPSEWTKWHRVIGAVMGECDGRNLMGDAFLGWRLHCLVKAGKIEMQGAARFAGDRSKVLVRRSEGT